MLIVLSRKIWGRKGYPDNFSEQMDLWRKATHMCIKKCSKGRATRISTGISLLFIGLPDCQFLQIAFCVDLSSTQGPRKNLVWKSNKWHLWFIHINPKGWTHISQFNIHWFSQSWNKCWHISNLKKQTNPKVLFQKEINFPNIGSEHILFSLRLLSPQLTHKSSSWKIT